MKNTALGNSYWNETGAYQSEYSELYEKHVPGSGSALTLHGELIRAISRLSYEYYNNGNCNACNVITEEVRNSCYDCGGHVHWPVEGEEEEECSTCGGSGEVYEEEETDVLVDNYYERFLELISKTVPGIDTEVEAVREVICERFHGVNDQFSDLVQQIYDNLMDKVIFHVLTTDDQNLPSWYEVD